MNPNSNVTPISDEQPQPQCRFTINAVLRGFPIVIEGEGRAGDLKLIIDRLLDSGAEPPTSARPEPTKTNGTPTCPTHGGALKPSSAKPGSYFCPKKNEDGSYCRHKA